MRNECICLCVVGNWRTLVRVRCRCFCVYDVRFVCGVVRALCCAKLWTTDNSPSQSSETYLNGEPNGWIFRWMANQNEYIHFIWQRNRTYVRNGCQQTDSSQAIISFVRPRKSKRGNNYRLTWENIIRLEYAREPKRIHSTQSTRLSNKCDKRKLSSQQKPYQRTTATLTAIYFHFFRARMSFVSVRYGLWSCNMLCERLFRTAISTQRDIYYYYYFGVCNLRRPSECAR